MAYPIPVGDHRVHDALVRVVPRSKDRIFEPLPIVAPVQLLCLSPSAKQYF